MQNSFSQASKVWFDRPYSCSRVKPSYMVSGKVSADVDDDEHRDVENVCSQRQGMMRLGEAAHAGAEAREEKDQRDADGVEPRRSE